MPAPKVREPYARTTTRYPAALRLMLVLIGSVVVAGYQGAALPTFASSAGAAAVGPTGASLRTPRPRLDLAVSELAAMPGGPPGVVVVVQRGDRRTVHAAGEAEVGNGRPSAEDHVRVASVAKAFTAATALSLVDDGRLGLDDTIAQHRPDLPAAWGNVTLRQLLNHTSGVPDFSASPGFGPAVVASLAAAPPPRALLGFVEDEPLRFAPGSEYEYSNSDNVIAALMIEAATGRPFAAVLREQVLDPLGLDDTSLPEGVEMPRPYLHGYELEPPDPLEDVSELLAAGWAWASGGIVSTPADMNDFVRGYVGGELFGEAVQAEQRSLFIPAAGSEPPGPGLNSASLGLFRYETSCGTVYGHSGNTSGYTQLIVASADGERSVTISISLQRTQKSEGQAADCLRGPPAHRAGGYLPGPRRAGTRGRRLSRPACPPIDAGLVPPLGPTFERRPALGASPAAVIAAERAGAVVAVVDRAGRRRAHHGRTSRRRCGPRWCKPPSPPTPVGSSGWLRRLPTGPGEVRHGYVPAERTKENACREGPTSGAPPSPPRLRSSAWAPADRRRAPHARRPRPQPRARGSRCPAWTRGPGP